MSSIYDWSLVPEENNRADEDIDWREGQKPSTINNSARQMMARIREYTLDVGGAVENEFLIEGVDEDNPRTTITLNPISKVQQYDIGLVFRFQAKHTNQGNTFIRLGGLAAIPVRSAAATGSGLLVGGEIQKGCIYEVVYYHITGTNILSGFWYLMNPTLEECVPGRGLRLIPAGVIAPFAMEAVPPDWLVCNGRAVSRTRYKDLLDAIGLQWGIGDGDTTFNIPDLRGMFLRGYDAGRGIDRNRGFGTNQGFVDDRIVGPGFTCEQSPTSTEADGLWPLWDKDNYLVLTNEVNENIFQLPRDVKGRSEAIARLQRYATVDEWIDTFRRVLPEKRQKEIYELRVRREGWSLPLMTGPCVLNWFRAALIFSGYFGEKIAPDRHDLYPQPRNPLYRTDAAGKAYLERDLWIIFLTNQVLSRKIEKVDDASVLPAVDASLSKHEGGYDKARTHAAYHDVVQNLKASAEDKPTVPMIPWREAPTTHHNIPVNVSIIYAIKT